MTKNTILLDDMIHFRQGIYNYLPNEAFHIESAQDLVNTLNHFKQVSILGDYHLIIPSHFYFNHDQETIYIPENLNNGTPYELKRTGNPTDVLDLYRVVAFGSSESGSWNPPIPVIFITANEHESIYSSTVHQFKSLWSRIAKVPLNDAKVFKVSEHFASKSIGSIISKL